MKTDSSRKREIKVEASSPVFTRVEDWECQPGTVVIRRPDIALRIEGMFMDAVVAAVVATRRAQKRRIMTGR